MVLEDAATARFRDWIDGYDWTVNDTYAAQMLCPYETVRLARSLRRHGGLGLTQGENGQVAFGFSRFCDLFTYAEWEGFEYSVDLDFYGNAGFGSPVGRAIGIGYQQEVVARLQNHTLGYSGSQINTTLDSSTETFPLNQSLYLDFSHDTNMASVLAALGLRQFAQPLSPAAHPGPHNFTVSHLTPFGARLALELIRTPYPVAPDRAGYLPAAGGETRYVHLVLNQRTVPLGWSFPDECDAARVDGWCELGAFLRAQEQMPALADYERACHGDYEAPPYGLTSDGAPPP